MTQFKMEKHPVEYKLAAFFCVAHVLMCVFFCSVKNMNSKYFQDFFFVKCMEIMIGLKKILKPLTCKIDLGNIREWTFISNEYELKILNLT